MVAGEYTIRLEAFEGPLDLLLFLIRRAEVDIHDIPIAAITEQYLQYLERLTTAHAGRRLDIEQAGEFLVMAATLMEIKSRMLSPKPAGRSDALAGDATDADQPADPRTELVRQLLEYKRYRDVTDRLEDWKSEWEHRYPSARAVIGRTEHAEESADPAVAPTEETRIDVDDLTLVDLVEAFSRIIEHVDFNRVGEHRVVVDDTPVEIHGERIIERLRLIGNDSGLAFDSLFEKRTRSEMIGIFLAILELVKQQRLRVEQEDDPGDLDGPARGGIVLRLGVEAGSAPAAAMVGNVAPASAN